MCVLSAVRPEQELADGRLERVCRPPAENRPELVGTTRRLLGQSVNAEKLAKDSLDRRVQLGVPKIMFGKISASADCLFFG